MNSNNQAYLWKSHIWDILT